MSAVVMVRLAGDDGSTNCCLGMGMEECGSDGLRHPIGP